MSDRDEAAVREWLSEAESGPWDAALVERLLGRMTPDARYYVYAWERPVTGRAALRDELMRQASLGFRNLRCEITAIASTGHTVLHERVDSMTIGKTPLSVHVVAVVEVDEAGQIAAWREYYDSKELTTQLGADASSAGSRA
jgi:limonene-1,2-epoxide hydrolase